MGLADKAAVQDWLKGILPPGTTRPPTELYFGIVKATGVDHRATTAELRAQLERYGYTVCAISMSSWLRRIKRYAIEHPGVDRKPKDLARQMQQTDAANHLREKTDLHDALARFAAFEIAAARHRIMNEQGQSETGVKIAYIVTTFALSAEVELFRDLYGERFFLIALFASDTTRRWLLEEYARRSGLSGHEKHEAVDFLLRSGQQNQAVPKSIVKNGLKGISGTAPKTYRQDVSGTYKDADLFLRVHSATSGLEQTADGEEIARLLRVVHGAPVEAVRTDERGIAHAFAAAASSLVLARQVGAAIISTRGDVIATGYNEVPRPGGSQYGLPLAADSADSVDSDARDHLEGGDVSDLMRRDMFRDLVGRFLTNTDWFETVAAEIRDPYSRSSPKQVKDYWAEIAKDPARVAQLSDAVLEKAGAIRDAELFDVIEYGRTVHAEMAALLSALRQGVDVTGATIYVTTFPCHECSRHLIASGIKRVVFVEPYAKSKALALHPDAVTVSEFDSPSTIYDPAGSDAQEGRPSRWPSLEQTVLFDAFCGLAPRRHQQLFSGNPRKYGRKERREKFLGEGIHVHEGQVVDWPPDGPDEYASAQIVRRVHAGGRAASVRLLAAQVLEETERMRHLLYAMRRTGKRRLTISNKAIAAHTGLQESDPLIALLAED